MAGKVNPIPEEYRGATPYLCVKEAARAIEFYKSAFGAREVMRMAQPDGRIGHAELRIGAAPIMLARRISGNEFSKSAIDRRHACQYSRLRRRCRFSREARDCRWSEAFESGGRSVLRRSRGCFRGSVWTLLVFRDAHRRRLARGNAKARSGTTWGLMKNAFALEPQAPRYC